jgi:hypothetical protein
MGIYSNGSFMAQKEIRAVVSGEDGTLLDVKNSKAVYAAGEDVKVDVSFVGPADKSIVEGAYILIKIISGGREVFSSVKENINLSAEPGVVEYTFKAPEDLSNYDLEVELGKGPDIFDRSIQSYKPMESNTTLTEDGRIQPKNSQGCFDDGICTDSESKAGECIDCSSLRKTSEVVATEKIELYKNIAFVILGVIILLFIVLRIRR